MHIARFFVLGNAQIGRVMHHVIYAPEQPHHQRLDEVRVLLRHALEVEALKPRQGKRVLYVVEIAL